MADTVAEIPPFLWDCVWQSTACLLIAVALSFLYAVRSARAHRALVLGLMACAVLPLLSQVVRHFGLGMFVDTTLPAFPAEEVTGTTALVHPPASGSTFPGVGGQHGGSWAWLASVFVWCWLAGSGLAFVRLLVSIAMAARVLARSRPLIDARMQATVEAAAAELGLRAVPTVFVSDDVQSPVMWGWRLHPALLVPRQMPAGSPSVDWKSILSHELAHCKRGDHLTGLFAELLACVFPWQPLSWWARRRLGYLSEQACDDWTLDTGHAPETYSDSLLAFVSQRRHALAPAAFTTRKSLLNRIKRILSGRKTDPEPGQAWTVRAALITGCLVLIVACAQTRHATVPGDGSSHRILPLANTSFEIGGDHPAGWLRGAAIEGVAYIWDKEVAYRGRASLCLRKTVQRYFPIAQWTQTVPHAGDAPYLRLGGWVKAEQAYKAILDVQFTDENENWRHEWAAYIGARETDDPPADHDWKYYSGVVAVPSDTEEIRIALQIYGPGTVWFDSVRAEYLNESAAASIR